MTTNIDIYRTANLLIQQHGEEATIHAAVSVTLDRYSHVIPNMQEDAAIIVDEGLREALQP